MRIHISYLFPMIILSLFFIPYCQAMEEGIAEERSKNPHSQHHDDSLQEADQEIKNTRAQYVAATVDILAGFKISYKEGKLYIFDPDKKILEIRSLEEKIESNLLQFPEDTSKIYPSNNKNFVLFKKGLKPKKSLNIINLTNLAFMSLGTKKHKDHCLSLVERVPHLSPAEDYIYFFQSERFNKKGKPCSKKDKEFFSSHTRIFYFDTKSSEIKNVATFPLFSDMVIMNGEESFILGSLENERDVKFYKVISSDNFYYHISVNINSRSINQKTLENLDRLLFFGKNIITFLLPEGNKKGIFSPFRYDSTKGTTLPILLDQEREDLCADISTYVIHPITNQMMIYGEDGLKLKWKTSEASKEYSKLADLLNSLQDERKSNLYFFDVSSNGKEMIFKEEDLNGNDRLLIVKKENNEKEEQAISPFKHTWIDLAQDSVWIIKKVPLPKPISDISVLTETYESRDGASIPMYIVRPKEASGPTPGIVYIHGGPQDRTNWAVTDLNEARYFAALGYTTIIPQYRGSAGFGLNHLQQGYRKHTTTVLDDIIDAAEWAVEKKYITKSKTIVMGESYGAFIVPLLLAKKREEFHFKGGFSNGGFYDVAKDIKESSESFNIHVEDIGWGSWNNPQDREEMRRSSPVNFTKDIQVPLVLLHGTKDDNCRYEQAELMSKALKKTKKPHALIKFIGGEHSISTQDCPLYLAILEKFLHETIGGSYTPLTDEEKKNKNIQIVHDTIGFFKNFNDKN